LPGPRFWTILQSESYVQIIAITKSEVQNDLKPCQLRITSLCKYPISLGTDVKKKKLTTGHADYANCRNISLPHIYAALTKVPIRETDLLGEVRRLQAHPASLSEGNLRPISFICANDFPILRVVSL